MAPPPSQTPSAYAAMKQRWEAARAQQAAQLQTEDGMRSAIQRRSAQLRKREAALFTRKQTLLAIWFGLVIALQLMGLWLFTSGFLLTRMVLSERSECDVLPRGWDGKIGTAAQGLGSVESGCWQEKSFDKAVVIVIDALRYDFVAPWQRSESDAPDASPAAYRNAFPVLYDTAKDQPQNALLLPFIADPPTTTLQRLKGLTTGTLPTFIDAGSNFAGEAIDEDNILGQLRSAGKKIVHLGDDTWHALFPGYFEKNLTRAYDSFNVWDLHTVDNGVIEHLGPLLQTEKKERWDFLIGHLLGVDHAGHRYGPDHPAMTDKLKQMNAFISSVISRIDDDTLLVVLGDHGMDSKGDHGGESDDEVEASLFMYTKRPFFAKRLGTTQLDPPLTAKERPVAQIDLVPTLSLLLGLPIPYNNLGAPIYEAFAGPDGSDTETLARAYGLTAGQIERYMASYAAARSLDADALLQAGTFWDKARETWQRANGRPSREQWFDLYTLAKQYQRETLAGCKKLWAQFDPMNMMHGLEVMALAVFVLVVYARGAGEEVTELTPGLLKRGIAGTVLGLSVSVIAATLVDAFAFVPTVLYATAMSGLGGCAYGLFRSPLSRASVPLPRSLLSSTSVIFTSALAVGFAANSFTIWEDRITLFFLNTTTALLFAASLRAKNVKDRVNGAYHAVLLAVLVRLGSLSSLCREEQMPYCESTYYASDPSRPYIHLAAPILAALILPPALRAYYKRSDSYHHSARLWYGIVFPTAMWLGAAYWTLTTADDAGWLTDWLAWGEETMELVAGLRLGLVQTALGLAGAVGYSLYAWSPPFLDITNTSRPIANGSKPSKQPPLAVHGLANAHGTRYLPLPSILTLLTLLVSKPLGFASVSLLLLQILSLVSALSAANLHRSALGPVALALLGNAGFFATGHQATLASMQWDAAFIPLKTVAQPWSAIVLLLNTLGPQLIAAVSVPLLALWDAPARATSSSSSNATSSSARRRTAPTLLSQISRHLATHIAFHATILLATSAWAMHLRRHLMLFRVFCPRFLVAALVAGTVEVLGVFGMVLVGGGIRWWAGSVGEVLGMPG